MKELEELRRCMETERPAPWESLPDLALYMDQVLAYMPRQLIDMTDDTLTSAMVNNYIKGGLLPRANGKKYSRTHLAYLTAICVLKQVVSVKDSLTLVQAWQKQCGEDETAVPETYEMIRQGLDAALNQTARELPQDVEREELPALAMSFALRSYADQLVCRQILGLLEEDEKKAKKKPAEEKE